MLKLFNQDLAVMDADEIFSKQLHQMEKEKKERDSKLKAQEKKVRMLIMMDIMYSQALILCFLFTDRLFWTSQANGGDSSAHQAVWRAERKGQTVSWWVWRGAGELSPRDNNFPCACKEGINSDYLGLGGKVQEECRCIGLYCHGWIPPPPPRRPSKLCTL